MSEENQFVEVSAPFSLTTPFFSEFVHAIERLTPAIKQSLGEHISIHIKKQIRHNEKVLAELVELIITSLIDKLSGTSTARKIRGISQVDYESLEAAVQKAEAEIRNHIRIQQQLKIYLESLEDKILQAETKLKQLEQANRLYEQNQKKHEAEQKNLVNKIRRYEEKMYEASRQSKWQSCERKSHQLLFNKASLNLREKSQQQSYIFNDCKSKHLINRIKDRSKKLKGSIVVAFQNMNYTKPGQGSEHQLQKYKGRGNSKLSSVQSYKQLNCSGQINDLKRRRKQFPKYQTQTGGKKQASVSLHF